MKFEKIKPGMTLYDVHRHKMGNTTMSTVGVWRVHVISVDTERRAAQVSWNSNKPTTYREHQLSKLREKEPVLIRSGLGDRLATREELKALRQKAEVQS